MFTDESCFEAGGEGGWERDGRGGEGGKGGRGEGGGRGRGGEEEVKGEEEQQQEEGGGCGCTEPNCATASCCIKAILFTRYFASTWMRL